MKRKWRILLIISFSVMIWLPLANFILLKVWRDEGTKRIKLNNVRYSDDAVYAIDGIMPDNTLKESVLITGWLFGNGYQEKKERFVSAVLRNVRNGKCLELKEDISHFADDSLSFSYMRFDVKQVYSDKRLENDRIVGFNIVRSTINVNDGIYELILHYKESASEEALKKTGKYVEKTEGILQLIEEPVVKCNNIKAQYSDDLKYKIEEIQSTAEMVTVSGWAFVEGTDSHSQNVFLEMETSNVVQTFYATTVQRDDISSMEDDSRLAWSGFKAFIPIRYIKDECELRVILENNGVKYASQKQAFIQGE